MINLLIIDNFKSISWLEMPLSKFNCLVGMNGAGKSTLLQAIDFATRQLSGDIEDWLNARGWEAKDLSCKLRKEQNIKMALSVSQGYHWRARFLFRWPALLYQWHQWLQTRNWLYLSRLHSVTAQRF